MAIPIESEFPEQDKDDKQTRARRGPSVSTRLSKLAKEVKELSETARVEDERDEKEHVREMAIIREYTGGAFDHLLRNVPMADQDRAFMRGRGWRI